MAAVITLGGQEFPISTLNIGQLEELTPVIREAFNVASKDGLAQAILVLSTAMRGHNPEMTLDAVRALPVSSIKEIQAAVIEIAKLGGFVSKDFELKKVAEPGEPRAAPVSLDPAPPTGQSPAPNAIN